MVFLNPSILFALLAASIPILIHILNFRKLQKIEFSTLSFLKELQKSKIKKIKIKQWLLLLLRTLIIIFLVFAFARPTLENVNLVGAASTAKSSSVFIIDNSFSMGYIGDDGSNFNRSKKTAKNIVSKMEDGDEFIFLISSDSVITTTSKETALDIIDELNIILLTESIFQKINNARLALKISKNINKEIFLFSDFQASTFEVNEDSAKFDIVGDNIKFYSFDMSIIKSSNYSVSNLTLENSIVELNKALTFSATITNSSNNIVSNLNASLFINEKRVAQQSITLEGGQEEDIKFESSLNSNGLIEARVELEEDNIMEDNISYLNFFVPKNIAVLILYDQISDITFLDAALNSSSTSNHIKVTKINISDIRNINPKEFNMIFLVSSKTEQFIDFENYLNNGGKLLFIPPSSITQTSLNILKEKLRLPGARNIITTSTSDINYAEFGKINFDHPIFISLFESKNKNEIESPIIYKYIKFNNSQIVKPIIRLIDNSTFLGEYNVGEGTVLFFNSAPLLNWSNLPIKGIFAPIISRIVYYLASANKKIISYKVGDPIQIEINKVTYPLIDVISPDGGSKINLQNYTNQIINYNHSTLPGSYKFYNNDQLLSYASVNVDPKESNLTKISEDLLLDSFNKLFGDNYLVFDSNDNYHEKIQKARYGTELWKYLLVIALILALIEMYVARSAKKDILTLN